MLTIKERKLKFIAEELLEIIADYYTIANKFDIIHRKRSKGNNIMEISEPRQIFLYLYKKHSDNMSYRKIKSRLNVACESTYIQVYVANAEQRLRKKVELEFKHQVTLIETELLSKIKDWQNNLANNETRRKKKDSQAE